MVAGLFIVDDAVSGNCCGNSTEHRPKCIADGT